MAHGCTRGEGLVFGWKATQCDSSFALLPRLSFQLVGSSWVGSSPYRIWFPQQQGVQPQSRERGEGEGGSTFGEIPLSLLAVGALLLKINMLSYKLPLDSRNNPPPICSSAPKVYFYPPQADCSQASRVKQHLVDWPHCEPK